MELFWRNAERLIDLYRRYRSPLHARLAWLVVIAGIALSATPWWMSLIAQLIERYTDLNTSEMLAWAAQTDSRYSLVIIALGLLYHAWSMWHTAQEQKTTRAKISDHDRVIFKELTGLVPEADLKDFIQRTLGDHSYFDADSDMLGRSIDHMRLASKRYLDDDLNEAVQSLRQRFDALAYFLATEFHYYPPNQSFPRGNRYCLHPEWNIDRAGHGDPKEDQMYDKSAASLRELCGAAIGQYEKVVVMAKKKHM